MQWRVAQSLTSIFHQINTIAPKRSKKSDGTIGDASHQTKDSDHNPWVKDGSRNVVTAADITHDPKRGCDCNLIVQSLVEARDPRIKYIIFNRRMWRSYDKGSLKAWKPAKYNGSNSHSKHVHISVNSQKKYYDNGDRWDLAYLYSGQDELLINGNLNKNSDSIPLAWGAMVDTKFKDKVVEISKKLLIDPNDLMAAMAFETARTFRPDIQNSSSKATGLIQFMRRTAEGLGTSTEELLKMTALQQLDYVYAYLRPYSGRISDIYDLYMAILWPRAIGKPKSYILFSDPSRAYKSNRGLDANNDLVITKAEAANRVVQFLVEGLQNDRIG